MRPRGASDPARQWVLKEIIAFLKSPVSSELLLLSGCPVSIYMTSSKRWIPGDAVFGANFELPHADLLLSGLYMPVIKHLAVITGILDAELQQDITLSEPSR